MESLYQESGHLIPNLAKKVGDELSHDDRKDLLERNCPEFPLSTQATLLGISRSGLYYQAVLPSVEEVSLRHRIDEIYTRWPFFGSRRIAATLGREGLYAGRDRVQISANGLWHTRSIRICSGMLRPNIRMSHGWMYLVAIIDRFPHYFQQRPGEPFHQ